MAAVTRLIAAGGLERFTMRAVRGDRHQRGHDRAPLDVVDARAWLTWCELGRTDPDIGGRVADVQLEERLLLDVVLGRRLDESQLDAAMALIEGLRAAICACVDPMPVDRARVVLARHLGQEVADSALARSSATIASGSSAE